MLDERLMGQLGALSKVDILAAIKVHLGCRVDPVQRSHLGGAAAPLAANVNARSVLCPNNHCLATALSLAAVLGQPAST